MDARLDACAFMAAIGKEQHGYVPNEWIVRRYLSLHWGAGAMPRKETWQRHEKAQRQLQQLGVIDATGAYKAPLQNQHTIHHSTFTIHHSPFTIHHSPFTIHHSTFTIHHSPFNIQHSTFNIQHSTFNITPTPPLFL